MSNVCSVKVLKQREKEREIEKEKPIPKSKLYRKNNFPAASISGFSREMGSFCVFFLLHVLFAAKKA